MFNWFKKRKVKEDTSNPLHNTYGYDKTIKVNGETARFTDHFHLNTNRDICMLSTSTILNHPLFNEVKFGTVSLEKNVSNCTLVEALSKCRSIYHEYIYGTIDTKLIDEVIKDTQSIVDSLEKLINSEYNDKALFDNPYVKGYLCVSRCSSISIDIRPYQVDDYINYLKEHNYTEYIDEYRKYIIEALASEVKSNNIQYDQPKANVSLYTKWKVSYVAQLERQKKNEEYKKIISEISAAYSVGKR
jgi:hypothetical protein